jgi:hypothetical protein
MIPFDCQMARLFHGSLVIDHQAVASLRWSSTSRGTPIARIMASVSLR